MSQTSPEMLNKGIPLSLYIHIPWCVKKCPYCDFNSYASKDILPEAEYILALNEDLKADLEYVQGRIIKSIFFGGGTPSLFSPQGIETILRNTASLLSFAPDIEITMEANPGTMEYKDFKDYRLAGINRVSLGVQSFQDEKLKVLGRVHTARESYIALDSLLNANFNSFNIDLMYGLPEQSIEDVLFDLKTAINFSPPHLSWYNLNIEPNTVFYQQPPQLPNDEMLWSMHESGVALLRDRNLQRYEVSAFSKAGSECIHNLNYWEFGDYLGIGAGAHAKLTDFKSEDITRLWKTRYPKNYLNPTDGIRTGQKRIQKQDLPFEFMMNALRLKNGVSADLFESRTFLTKETIKSKLKLAKEKGLLEQDAGENNIVPTALGYRFLNDLVQIFLD
jgi:oxygen-independent coproporphyrinogen-3 oxidase